VTTNYTKDLLSLCELHGASAVTANEIEEWKKKHTPQHCENKGGAEDDDDKKKNPAHLGLRYWRSFLKHHPQITSKKGI